MRVFLLFVTLVFIGCSQTKEKKPLEVAYKETSTPKETPLVSKESTPKEDENTPIKDETPAVTTLQIKDLTFIKRGELYVLESNTTVVLAFLDEERLSKEQKRILDKIGVKYYIITQKEILKSYGVSTFPTLVLHKKGSIEKYDSIVPLEVLKQELK